MFSSQMKKMLETIEAETRYSAESTGRSALQQRVLEAMSKVPREEFVPPAMRPFAYANNALPIGLGQTISQPFIVALMTDLLCPEKDHVVLEVGTGSGYQAAVLSLLVRQVYSIEFIPELADQARSRLHGMGYYNVEVRQGDGYLGWPDHAPFNGVIVTAAASHVPPALKEQLGPWGRLVIPVGLPYMHQELMLLEKDGAGKISTRDVLGVAFVPLVRKGERGGSDAI